MLILFLTFSAGILAPVLAQVCPEPFGVQTYPHETFCDKFHLVRAMTSSFLGYPKTKPVLFPYFLNLFFNLGGDLIRACLLRSICHKNPFRDYRKKTILTRIFY